LNTRVFELFDQLKVSPRGEYELTDTLQLLVKETKIKLLATTDYWIPIGYPWHILEAVEYFVPKIESQIEGTVEENVTIKGKVILPKSSTIKAGTYIEGNLIVGENSTIGPNAYLRDNVVVGSNCKVGFAVELKNSVIGSGTQIPHLSYLGDSILGNNVNFAGQSMATNFRHDSANIKTPIKGVMTDTGRMKFGTVIGDNAMLGANTVIYPGRKIWPGKTTLPAQTVDRDVE
jgi:NDP-sugar pyrophosphorylase family protein